MDALLFNLTRLRGAVWALVAAPVAYLSFSAGGYFPPAADLTAVALLVGLAVHSMCAARPFAGVSRRAALPLAALSGYALWQLISMAWAQGNDRAVDAFNLSLLYAAAFSLSAAPAYSPSRLRSALRCAFVVLAAVSLAALISRVLPDIIPSGSTVSPRLEYPLSYSNAEGFMAGAALILGVHLSASVRERRRVRVLAAALLPGIAATLLLTFSRGALAAASAGILLYVAVGRPKGTWQALAAAVPPCALAAVVTLNAVTLASVHAHSRAGLRDGQRVSLLVGGCMLAAGLIRLALVRDHRWSRQIAARLRRLQRRRALILAAILAAVLSLALPGFMRQEYHRFLTPGGLGNRHNRDRLSDVANNGRLALWAAALDAFSAHPLQGTGAGSYRRDFARMRTSSGYVSDAHSLYLQSLAELGVVGFALITVFCAGLLVLLAGRVRGPDGTSQVAVLAATLAWTIHQAVDWDWQMPASTIWVFVLCGVALAGGPGARVARPARAALAVALLLATIAPALAGLSFARLQSARAAFAQGNCHAASAASRASLGLLQRPQALQLLGICELQAGLPAVGAMVGAERLEARNWEGAFWVANAQAAAGLDPRPATQRAVALNPREPLAQQTRAELAAGPPVRWEQLAPGLRNGALTSGRLSVLASDENAADAQFSRAPLTLKPRPAVSRPG